MKPGSDASSLEGMPPEARVALEARLLGERRARPPANTIPRRKSAGPCPLSFAQSRLWLAERINPVPGRYNIGRAFRLRGALNVDALRSAFDALVARHEVLRTRFVLQDGLPQQVVAPHEPFVLEILDLRRGPADTETHDAFVRRLTRGGNGGDALGDEEAEIASRRGAAVARGYRASAGRRDDVQHRHLDRRRKRLSRMVRGRWYGATGSTTRSGPRLVRCAGCERSGHRPSGSRGLRGFPRHRRSRLGSRRPASRRRRSR